MAAINLSLLEFRKTIAISLLFDRSSPYLVETLGIDEEHIYYIECIGVKIQNDGRHHPQFRGNFCHFFTI